MSVDDLASTIVQKDRSFVPRWSVVWKPDSYSSGLETGLRNSLLFHSTEHDDGGRRIQFACVSRIDAWNKWSGLFMRLSTVGCESSLYFLNL